jgi:O-antigen ligase
MKLLEKMTAVAIFLSSMSFFFTILYGKEVSENVTNGIDTGSVHTAITVLNLILFLLAFLFAARRYKQFLRAAQAAWPVLIVVAFCLLSTAWSIDPELTLRRALFLFGTVLFGIYVGGRYTVPQISGFFLSSMYVMCGFTLIYRVVLPAYVLDTIHNNALRGLTTHKNAFGEIMAFFILQLVLWEPPRRLRLVRYASIPVAFLMLVLARSSTSLIVCVLVTCLIPTLNVVKLPFRLRWPAILFTGVLVAAIGAALSLLTNTILGALGKDATLTGRSMVWKLVLIAISRRPLLGYGFDVFWQGLKGPSLEIIAGTGWVVPNAHNGFLQAALDIGYLGLALVLVNLVLATRLAIAYCHRTPGRQGLWPMAFLLFYVLHASTEATLLTREGVGILLFVILYTALATAERNLRKHPISPAKPTYEVLEEGMVHA